MLYRARLRPLREVIEMASESEYLAAIARVSSGTASQRYCELVQQAAKGVVSLDDKARAALRCVGR